MTIDPTPAAAEARATKATEAMVVAACEDLDWDPNHPDLYAAVEDAINAALAAEAKDAAAPSPETGWRLVPLESTPDAWRTLGAYGWVYSDGRTPYPNTAEPLFAHPAAAALPPPEAKEGAAPEGEVVQSPTRRVNARIAARSKATALPIDDDGAAPSPETGWRLVPVVATQDQLDAVTSSDQIAPFTDSIMAGVYREMIAAAPAAPSPDLAALEELTGYLERCERLGIDTVIGPTMGRLVASALRSVLKAQPNAGTGGL